MRVPREQPRRLNSLRKHNEKREGEGWMGKEKQDK